MRDFWKLWNQIDKALDDFMDNVYGESGCGCLIVPFVIVLLAMVLTSILRWLVT